MENRRSRVLRIQLNSHIIDDLASIVLSYDCDGTLTKLKDFVETKDFNKIIENYNWFIRFIDDCNFFPFNNRYFNKYIERTNCSIKNANIMIENCFNHLSQHERHCSLNDISSHLHFIRDIQFYVGVVGYDSLRNRSIGVDELHRVTKYIKGKIEENINNLGEAVDKFKSYLKDNNKFVGHEYMYKTIYPSDINFIGEYDFTREYEYFVPKEELLNDAREAIEFKKCMHIQRPYYSNKKNERIRNYRLTCKCKVCKYCNKILNDNY